MTNRLGLPCPVAEKAMPTTNYGAATAKCIAGTIHHIRVPRMTTSSSTSSYIKLTNTHSYPT
ncbi:uncharacterized protein ARMOST_14615 [Armillaria ostoyae]|uniref:Uncharacterized protein n=1 Tax=Armillaria ostoyae TaxID=47428 RepID=A0A284RR11_ARMOS|nr:uncharacterized protein ARMOST_14615 [Armillaria ostoyae]